MPFCAPDTAGALERGTLTATALGRVARQINGSNELWLAIALTQPVMADLAPPQLAAVLSGIVSGDVRASVRPSVWRPFLVCAPISPSFDKGSNVGLRCKV
jgi:DSHCT (NUC185) domain